MALQYEITETSLTQFKVLEFNGGTVSDTQLYNKDECNIFISEDLLTITPTTTTDKTYNIPIDEIKIPFVSSNKELLQQMKIICFI